MNEVLAEGPKIAIKNELTKSFKSINYSQWERQRNSNNASVSTNELKNATTTSKKSGKLFWFDYFEIRKIFTFLFINFLHNIIFLTQIREIVIISFLINTFNCVFGII
jgi:hypothetical protein